MKLQEVINNRKEKFFVLMGFTSDELLNLPNKLLNLPIFNGINEYIYNPNKTLTPDLFTNFFTTNQKSWLTYEEFFILRGFIESAIKKEDIVFIYNNKYLGYTHLIIPLMKLKVFMRIYSPLIILILKLMISMKK